MSTRAAARSEALPVEQAVRRPNRITDTRQLRYRLPAAHGARIIPHPWRAPELPEGSPTAILHHWLAQLSYWSGGPVQVVLCADGPCWWQEPWTDALAEAPGHLLRVQFRIRGEGGDGE